MNNFFPGVLKWLSAALGLVAGLFGQWSAVMTCLLVMNIVDYVTGFICALRGKSTKTESGGASSKAGFDGLARKAFIWLVILLTAQLDKVLGNTTAVFQTAAAFYYIANEGLSILENAALMGVPMPPFIKKVLEVLLEQSGNAETKKLPEDYEDPDDE